MKNKALINQLKQAIFNLHGCKSKWIESVPIKETFQGQTVWDGVVEVFELINHLTAQKCYAWSYVTDDSKTKFITVLHKSPVDSPVKAVRAAIANDYKNKLDS